MEHDNHRKQHVKGQKVCLGKCSIYGMEYAHYEQEVKDDFARWSVTTSISWNSTR